jgi:hypothetical protein
VSHMMCVSYLKHFRQSHGEVLNRLHNFSMASRLLLDSACAQCHSCTCPISYEMAGSGPLSKGYHMLYAWMLCLSLQLV